MNKFIRKETEFAGKKLILETGEIALQANMAVKATYGDTVVLVTVVSGSPNPDIDFFPLTVNYEEKLYAGGLIKTSRFVKRAGRPTDESVISKRLIDHAVRPLFPSDYMDEVQIIVTILSLDEDSDPEFLAMIGTSAALHTSDIPWTGPVVAARVGYVDEKYVLNPDRSTIQTGSALNMIVSFVGIDRKFLAVEAEADILPEDTIIGAMNYARDNLEDLSLFIEDFRKEVNPDGKKYKYESKSPSDEVMNDVADIAKEKIVDLIKKDFDKIEHNEEMELVKEDVLTKLEGKYKKSDMVKAIKDIEKEAIKKIVLEDNQRVDGRGMKEIRPITVKTGVLPRTHGTGLFTRGLTQVLTVATLGSPSLELLIQDMYGEYRKRYIHYYTFAPFSVGETGRMMGPGSREIGHGMLAEKALKPVIPNQDEFPYMILLMSETLSSNGSSSMAATCGSTLALMDAGVPIKDMVSGVHVGLFAEDDFSKYQIVTDIIGLEDSGGCMDYKMTGTEKGVTAIQCDIKFCGIPMEIMPEVIAQAKEGRLHVLGEMKKVISEPRSEVSKYAPKLYSTTIPEEEIGKVIGTGGKTIKELQERTGAEIHIEDDGRVVVSSLDEQGAKQALDIISNMVRKLNRGEIFEGKVVDLLDFGALVEILPGRVGLLHVSEIADEYIDRVEDHLSVGDMVKVKVVDFGENGKISLSKKAVDFPDSRNYERRSYNRDNRSRDGNRDRGYKGRDRRKR